MNKKLSGDGPIIKVCPGTLAAGFNSYSPACLKRMFDGKKVNYILPYDRPQDDEEVAELFLENRKHISISGVQEKLSLTLEKKQLRLTNDQESGTYILKPVPRDLKKVDQVPANEHLTMQIARQAYGMNTAENAIVFFRNGTPAYLTRRFDIKTNEASAQLKWGKEDFATLSGKTKMNAGVNFKYASSYEEGGEIIRRFVAAWRVEIEKYFSLVIFNFLFSNGDAHLKNFSLLGSSAGDYLLSPAYDLINTRLHFNDTFFALERGLFADGYRSQTFIDKGYPVKTDFVEFARRTGVAENRIDKILQPFLIRQNKVEELISRSFLSESSKSAYLIMYNTRRKYLSEP